MTVERGNRIGISPEQLIKFYPQLYHMAEADSWASICKNGLLSTSALLDIFEITGTSRFAIESEHRPKLIKISHPRHGNAIIRDQIPMREKNLHECLKEMNIQEWYELLNHKVFFWLTRERLITLLSAKAYRGRRHTVITIDTPLIIERHLDRITLSPINSGSTIYKAQPRGQNTFLPLHNYPFEMRRKLRGRKNAIAELAIDYNVADIAELTIRAEHVQGTQVIETLYER